MHGEAKKTKEQACMVHLFGVKYEAEIKENKKKSSKSITILLKSIVEKAGLMNKKGEIAYSWYNEINKGIKLSKYVKIKDEYKDRF
ncbi:MAG: hypothetical protein JRJ44_07875 [Deltaproteobacteria bacterium]|nr:hypothetical protein [Deltaproteobacteria bacterium]